MAEMEGESQQQGEVAETDWEAKYREAVRHSREWESRSKANAEKARAYDELQEASKTELQKATERAEGYKRKLEALRAEGEREKARERVSAETGVPVNLIAGDDEDAMREFAQAVAKFAKPDPAPKAPRAGTYAPAAGERRDADKREFVRAMFGSENQ